MAYTFCLFFILLSDHVSAQSSYTIQLIELDSKEKNEQCYEVVLSTTEATSWNLGSQNYRLFFDSEMLTFKNGTSLLGDDFQDFTLVQVQEKVNASHIDGCLHYVKSLGFLNYAIDLLTTSSSSAMVPTAGNWLPTTQLCFVKTTTGEASFQPTLTWAREEVTKNYAHSFVEISELVGANQSASAKGIEYKDIGNPCIALIPEERNPEDMLLQDDLAQFDIRLKEVSTSIEQNVCYEVGVRSATEETWYLSGQNYRLYYDASQLVFSSGKSLLGENYQSFNLVQNITESDASSAEGCLHFATHLGFLNYAIDQLDTSIPGAEVSTDTEWLPTTQLCFTKKQQVIFAPTLVWGRQEVTGGYATSFVEISEWKGVNEVSPSQAANYIDISDPCEAFVLPTKGIYVQAKAILQGVYNTTTGLMNDALRSKALIPAIEPYSEMTFFTSSAARTREAIDEALFKVTGEEAIVDWVVLELRDPKAPAEVVSIRCVLLLRNGAIVDIDGKSPVLFEVEEGFYHIAIRHRNHLGVMSADSIYLSTQMNDSFIDFSSPTTPTFGNYARVEVAGTMCLWGGNADMDNYIVFQGGGVALPDGNALFFDIFQDPTNTNYNYNHITRGYYASDLNLDGEVRYQGVDNDRDEFLFFNVIQHKENKKFYTNFFIKEQLP